MKNTIYLAVGLIILGIIAFFSTVNYQNKFVDLDENANKAFADLQSDYQRRADLIPNLVATVKGVADFEQETITAVTEARARATSINIDPSNVTPDQLAAFQKAQSGLSSSLGRLLVVSENYPQLRANENFRELQVQLEGTENRIKVARNKYNEAVTEYNKAVRSFPGNLFSGLFGFDRREPFQADENAQNAPTVNFD